ncbi:MAG: thiamine diphosphokinase [Clostridia bacterium]|nr:thiamine diphosphokinase [Clostridia bacterium]
MTHANGTICRIFGGGEFAPAAPFAPEPGDLVIAADSGLEVVRRLGLTPDLVVGDFDSLGKTPTGDNVVTLPVEKDVTDAAAAVSLGRERGYSRFAFFGCTGGRPDHTFAAYQLLADLAARGERGLLFGDGFTVTAIKDGALSFPALSAGTLSVFSVGGDARGVTISGVYYLLSEATLTPTFPLGISNSFTGKPVSIEVKDGTLLVFAEGYPIPAFGE